MSEKRIEMRLNFLPFFLGLPPFIFVYFVVFHHVFFLSLSHSLPFISLSCVDGVLCLALISIDRCFFVGLSRLHWHRTKALINCDNFTIYIQTRRRCTVSLSQLDRFYLIKVDISPAIQIATHEFKYLIMHIAGEALENVIDLKQLDCWWFVSIAVWKFGNLSLVLARIIFSFQLEYHSVDRLDYFQLSYNAHCMMWFLFNLEVKSMLMEFHKHGFESKFDVESVGFHVCLYGTMLPLCDTEMVSV